MAETKQKSSSQITPPASSSIGQIISALKIASLWSFVIVLFSLLIMISAQETFKDVLEPLGLYHDRTGALVDCSDPRNKQSRYCNNGDYEPPHRLRDNPGSGIEFNLSE